MSTNSTRESGDLIKETLSGTAFMNGLQKTTTMNWILHNYITICDECEQKPYTKKSNAPKGVRLFGTLTWPRIGLLCCRTKYKHAIGKRCRSVSPHAL